MNIASSTGESLFYIAKNGNIGLGDISPDYQFTIFNDNTNDYLAYIYNASSTASSGGGLDIRVDGDGNILNLNHNGTDVVTISGANTIFNNPLTFGSAGDVSVAYDLLMTNDTAGNILFDGPGYIRTDSSWENLSLTLSAANLGDVVVDDAMIITGTTTIDDVLYVNTFDNAVGIGTSSPNAMLAIYDSAAGVTDNVFTVATGTGGSIFRVNGSGQVYADGSFNGGGADYAEYFYASDKDLKSGEVVCIDVTRENTVKRCDRGSDSNVMGIVSTDPSIVGNAQESYINNENYKIIGMLGQVPACVSAENGDIRPGDSLTSAENNKGCVMRAEAGDPTVGVALEAFASEDTSNKIQDTNNNQATSTNDQINVNVAKGEIKVLISRRNKSLTVEMNNITGELTMMATAIDDLSSRVSIIEGDIDSILDSQSSIFSKLSIINDQLSNIGSSSHEVQPFMVTADGNIKLRPISVVIPDFDSESMSNEAENASSTEESETAEEPDVAVFDIETLENTEITALVVNQKGSGDVADFQADGVSIVNIAETGKVAVVGEMSIDGRLMVCSGSGCGSALDMAGDETMGDMGVEGTGVGGAFAGYFEKRYVLGPRSFQYGTLPGFCVGAYEAQIPNSEFQIPNSNPHTYITQGEASLVCQAEGEGYHLISENEWLTIAENIIRNNENDIDAAAEGLQLSTFV